MNEQDFQTRLGELMAQINEIPEPARTQLEQLASETRGRHDRVRKTVGELQESLDYLRLSVKYLVFDLEATRRENEYLRGLITKDDRTEADGAD
jgi:hypothetical protein